MKALHKSFWMLALLGLIVSSFVTSGLAQVNPANPTTLQSRNFQAGTVNDPGSSLIYLIDSGVRPISTAAGATVLAQMQAAPFNLTDGTSAVSAYKNFVSITNTNPTSAVTVHFRYFSDMCTDLLDFLVVLTQNDVLMFDPFNFVIPGTTLNVRSRLFGTNPVTVISGVTITPISPLVFGSGRFLLFATASGVDTDGTDSNAEIRFPFGTSADGADATHIGTSNSLLASTRTNLNPFNASAMSFNWLIGAQTLAINAQFNNDASANGVRDQVSFGNVAWARPAVDIAFDVADGYPDADGNPVVADGLILTGREAEVGGAADGDGGGVLLPTGPLGSNTLALRGELNSGRYNGVPAGPTATVGNTLSSTEDNTVVAGAGAIAWNVIFPSELTAGAPREGSLPENQLAEFVSVADDYNGSKNGSSDRSYNLMPTRSHYQMDIYNNNELRLTTIGIQFPVSPFLGAVAPGLGITVECISVGLGIQPFGATAATLPPALVKTGSATDLTPDGRLRISDLNSITGSDGAAIVRLHIDDPVAANDVSAGWIRFNRIRTRLLQQTAGAQFGYDGDAAAGYPVFFNTARYNVGFEGFGAGWWLFGVRERAGATP